MKSTDLTPIQQARADLESKKAAISTLEKEIEAIRGAIRYMEGIYSETPKDGDAPKLGPVFKINGRKFRFKTKESVASEFCEKYVAEHGASTGAELYTAFIGSGRTLAGENRNAQMATLAGYLKRVGKLMFYRDSGRWYFVGQPIRLVAQAAVKF